MYTRAKYVLTSLVVLLFSVSVACAQQAAQGQGRPAFAQQELDQMLAPIALYPDSLLSQILMAATYPREVVEAARWSRRNPGLNGDRAVRAVEQADWDPSVKSLVAFPQILDMMDEKLNWTEDLGDAFLDQEAQVMDTVQYLRRKAHTAGNLSSSDQFRVDVEDSSFTINFSNPEVAYLPYYNPTIVFGTWWWPAYQPVYWAPWPGYYSRAGYARGYAWGPAIPVSRGFFFGAPDWRHRHVKIVNVNNYYYRPAHVNRPAEAARHANAGHGAAHVWQHDTAHRRDAPYRNAGDASSRHRAANAGAAPEGRREPRERDTSRGDGRGAERNTPAPVVAAQPETHVAPNRPHAPAAAGSTPRGADGRGPASRGHDRPASEGRGVAANAPAPAVAAQPETRGTPNQTHAPAAAERGPRGAEARGQGSRGHDRPASEGRGVTANAPAPAVAAQPETRGAPVRPNTADSTPRGVPSRGQGAREREHDRPAFEGRGEAGHRAGQGRRPEARVEPGNRQAQRDSSQPPVAATNPRPVPERTPAPAPVVAREPAPRSAPAPAIVQSAVHHPDAEQRPAVAHAAHVPDGAGRRADARPAGGRDRASNSATESADGRNPRHP